MFSDYYNFVIILNKKQQQTNKKIWTRKVHYLRNFKNSTTCLAANEKKKKCARKFSFKVKLLVTIFASSFLKIRWPSRIDKTIPNLWYKLDKFHFWKRETADEKLYLKIFLRQRFDNSLQMCKLIKNFLKPK